MKNAIQSVFEKAHGTNAHSSGFCWMPTGSHTNEINEMFSKLPSLRHQIAFAIGLVKLWLTADEKGAIELCGQNYIKDGFDPKGGLFGYSLTGDYRQFRVWARTCTAYRTKCDDEQWDCYSHVDSGGQDCLISIYVEHGCEDFLRETCIETFHHAFPEFRNSSKRGAEGVKALFWTNRPMGRSYKELAETK